MTFEAVETWISENLSALIEKYDVPGAAVAVLAGGQVFDHAAGVLSKTTGVEATPDSVFQIGSITKVWTATLVMQLVDEGKLDLDLPIRTYVPAFKIAEVARLRLRAPCPTALDLDHRRCCVAGH